MREFTQEFAAWCLAVFFAACPVFFVGAACVVYALLVA